MASEAEKRREAMAQLGKAWGIALEFIVSVLLFAGIGWLLDLWLGTTPWLVLAGMAFGFFGGVYRLMRQANQLGNSMRDKPGPDGRPPGGS